jgi:hypothetical protein
MLGSFGQVVNCAKEARDSLRITEARAIVWLVCRKKISCSPGLAEWKRDTRVLESGSPCESAGSMAEGEGFEPPVRFPVQRVSITREGSDRL